MSQNIRSHVLLRSLAQWGIFPYFHSTFPNFKLLCNLMNCLHIQICCQNWFFPPLFDWHGYQKEFKRIIFWHFWTILIIFSGNSLKIQTLRGKCQICLIYQPNFFKSHLMNWVFKCWKVYSTLEGEKKIPQWNCFFLDTHLRCVAVLNSDQYCVLRYLHVEGENCLSIIKRWHKPNNFACLWLILGFPAINLNLSLEPEENFQKEPKNWVSSRDVFLRQIAPIFSFCQESSFWC